MQNKGAQSREWKPVSDVFGPRDAGLGIGLASSNTRQDSVGLGFTLFQR